MINNVEANFFFFGFLFKKRNALPNFFYVKTKANRSFAKLFVIALLLL